MHVGFAAGDGVQATFHVVDGFAAQQSQAPAEDFGGGAVVDVQPCRAAGDVDADVAQADAVVVDALVGVAGDEDVVGRLGDRGAQQSPLVGAEVLGFVDDDVAERLIDDWRSAMWVASRRMVSWVQPPCSVEQLFEFPDRLPRPGRVAPSREGGHGRSALPARYASAVLI